MQEKMQRRMSLGEPVSPCGVPKGQQLFWWNRRAALIRIQRREVLGHINKDSAHQFPDVAQRMPFRHPLLKREVGKQSSLIPKSPAHRQIALVASRQRESYKTIRGDRFFSKLLDQTSVASADTLPDPWWRAEVLYSIKYVSDKARDDA